MPKSARSVVSPSACSVPAAALKVEVVDESPELWARDAKAYRGVAARCN